MMSSGRYLIFFIAVPVGLFCIFDVYVHITGYKEALVRRDVNRSREILAESQGRIPMAIPNVTLLASPISLNRITGNPKDSACLIYIGQNGRYILYRDHSATIKTVTLQTALSSPANSANMTYDPTNGTYSAGFAFATGRLTLPRPAK